MLSKGADSSFLSKALTSRITLSPVILVDLHDKRAGTAGLVTRLRFLHDVGPAAEERTADRRLLARRVDGLEADVSDVGGKSGDLLRR